ncbi:hypothetical protein GCM10022288_23200 [Gryllotalpicola kribbensis]|uniref:Uncharacterized protein n=1 Tax=Gryllotalpicola kribbensis TaxID=993084 RepID=A0ABP8AWC5_9MICO
MARHRSSPTRVPFWARSRRPAVLGGALGGGTALIAGLAVCAAISVSGAGVNFHFSDSAVAAVLGDDHAAPTVTRDLPAASSTAPTQTPSVTPSRALAQAQSAAADPASPAAATPSTTPTPAQAQAQSSSASASSVATPSATASAQPSSTPTSSASPSSTPAPTAAPIQLPTPQPSEPGDEHCLLGIVCI